jgi:hypothetical protein
MPPDLVGRMLGVRQTNWPGALKTGSAQTERIGPF